jgi:nicotinate-nucleotide adenylyltransferase
LQVAVFGGSFNPPHVAHVMACALVRALHDVERILVVPTFQHPFAKALAPYEDRVAMCELAMSGLNDVEVSRIEEELGGESRTLRTLEHLRAVHPDWSMRLVMGSDTFAESSKWFRFDVVRELAPPIVLARSGPLGGSKVLLPAISSTDVRARVAAGAWSELEDLVLRSVLAHIRSRGLYGSEVSAPGPGLSP